MKRMLPLLVAVLMGCHDGGPVRVHQSSPDSVIWIVGWDATFDSHRSVPQQHYKLYPEMLKRFVLFLCKGGDEVRFLRIDSDPIDDDIAKFALERQPEVFGEGLKRIYEHARSVEQLPQNQGYTNLGGVLKYALERNQLKGHEKSKVVVVCLTDGNPTGKQDFKTGRAEGVQVIFLGVEEEENLSSLVDLTTRVGIGDDHVCAVLFRDWEEDGVLRRFSTMVGRRPNRSIDRYLNPNLDPAIGG